MVLNLHTTEFLLRTISGVGNWLDKKDAVMVEAILDLLKEIDCFVVAGTVGGNKHMAIFPIAVQRSPDIGLILGVEASDTNTLCVMRSTCCRG